MAAIWERSALKPPEIGSRELWAQMGNPELEDSSTVNVPIVLPLYLSRILRTFTLLEGVCKEVDPQFNYFNVILSFLTNNPSRFINRDFIEYKMHQDIDDFLESLIL